MASLLWFSSSILNEYHRGAPTGGGVLLPGLLSIAGATSGMSHVVTAP